MREEKVLYLNTKSKKTRLHTS
uniref:Uncharacterized protein n=1 Tax=Anguilla anguilla TaxID=7936 RepID=A0A0E9SJN5_ANGAN